MPEVFDFVAVALLGALVGGAELVSRYRDAPHAAVYTRPALVYVALNVTASVLALALIRGYGWTFNATGASQRWTQVLVGGVGAMALFRTSLFMVRAGDRDIGVGQLPANLPRCGRSRGGSSVLALALIRGFGWTLNAAGPSQRWTQVLNVQP